MPTEQLVTDVTVLTPEFNTWLWNRRRLGAFDAATWTFDVVQEWKPGGYVICTRHNGRPVTVRAENYPFRLLGFVPILTDLELCDTDVIRAIRNKAARQGIPYRKWYDHATNAYFNSRYIFVDGDGRATSLNWDSFDELEDTDHWFRDFCWPVAEDECPHIVRRSFERVRAFGTLLRTYP